MWKIINPETTTAQYLHKYKFNFFTDTHLGSWDEAKLVSLKSQLNRQLVEQEYIPIEYKQGSYAISIIAEYKGSSPLVMIVVSGLLAILITFALIKLTKTVQEFVETPVGALGAIGLFIIAIAVLFLFAKRR